MQSQRFSATALFRRLSLLSTLLAAAGFVSVSAQVAPPPPSSSQSPSAPDAQSSSSDVQTAGIFHAPRELYKRDVAVSGFGQLTQYINGNSVRSDTTTSGGGMASLRQSPRWWFGYELNYGYTKYTDAYYFGTYRVKHNTNEFSLAYLVDRNLYKGWHAFGSIGVGGIIFSPTQYGGSVNVVPSAPPSQSLPMYVYSVGTQKLVTSRLGVRVQYRVDEYKDPNFKFEALNTHKLRQTQEPAIGVYYRF